MEKHDGSLFQIGEVTKILGTTRKALLVYEELGLLTPAVKNPDSGYRYYSADNMTQIRSIRALQSLGLTLAEVKEYYYDTENIHAHLQRLMDLRAALDRNIQMLQLRSTKRGDLTVHKTHVPKQVCFVRRYPCHDVAEATRVLRDTYIAAARTGKMDMNGRMFTMRMSPRPGELDIMCCIPVEDSFDGPERMEFSESPALCIYFRGSYEDVPAAAVALMKYVKENGIQVAGHIRSVYMEGPPNRGANSDDYITQVVIPIQSPEGY